MANAACRSCLPIIALTTMATLQHTISTLPLGEIFKQCAWYHGRSSSRWPRKRPVSIFVLCTLLLSAHFPFGCLLASFVLGAVDAAILPAQPFRWHTGSRTTPSLIGILVITGLLRIPRPGVTCYRPRILRVSICRKRRPSHTNLCEGPTHSRTSIPMHQLHTIICKWLRGQSGGR